MLQQEFVHFTSLTQQRLPSVQQNKECACDKETRKARFKHLCMTSVLVFLIKLLQIAQVGTIHFLVSSFLNPNISSGDHCKHLKLYNWPFITWQLLQFISLRKLST